MFELHPSKMNNDEIDEHIRQLIKELNVAGFKTWSSCQGRRSIENYNNERHCEHSFITFDEIPKKYKQKARKLGLEVWNCDMAISPIYENDEQETFIRHNLEFPDRVRKLFLM